MPKRGSETASRSDPGLCASGTSGMGSGYQAVQPHDSLHAGGCLGGPPAVHPPVYEILGSLQ